MRTHLIALASALAVTTGVASAAEAGGGIRLGFGVPLGSFVATPAHGGGAYHAPKVRKNRGIQTAHKPQKPAQRVAKAEPRQDARKKDIKKHESVERSDPKTDDTAKAAPVTGSSALIQGSIPSETPASATPEVEAPDVKAEALSDRTVTAHTDRVPDESEDCKKFIPAVGMTVSVGCD